VAANLFGSIDELTQKEIPQPETPEQEEEENESTNDDFSESTD
jgi:hypothetical protein